jgi:hypothetical protein
MKNVTYGQEIKDNQYKFSQSGLIMKLAIKTL